MHAMTLPSYGGPDVMEWAGAPEPKAGPGEVVVDVAAAGVNRADVSQRQGHYPPPPGIPDYPGLECSGRISELGAGVTGWAIGDEVCALLAGGGYAERVGVPVGQLFPVPAGVSLVDAAALPEVCCTVWANVFMLAGLAPGHVLLVHGGSSGIGTMAIQLGVWRGARVFCTAGTPDKLAACRDLGAEVAIQYHTEDFVHRVMEETATHGADVILDIVGAAYLGKNLDALASDGHLVVIGMQGGSRAELDLGKLMSKRASVSSTGLRYRTRENKAVIVAAVIEEVWPGIAAGEVRPIVDRRIPIEKAADAHRILEASDHVGKILLTV